MLAALVFDTLIVATILVSFTIAVVVAEKAVGGTAASGAEIGCVRIGVRVVVIGIQFGVHATCQAALMARIS